MRYYMHIEFNDAVSGSDHVVTNGRMINGYRIANDMAADSCGILQVLLYHLTGRTEQNT